MERLNYHTLFEGKKSGANKLAVTHTSQEQRFSDSLANLSAGPNGNNRLIALQEIFFQPQEDLQHSLLVKRSLTRRGQSMSEQMDHLRSKPMLEMAQVIAESLPAHLFELGMILSQVPYAELPDMLKDSIPYSSKKLSVLPYHPQFNWALCDDAERRLDKSIELQKAFVSHEKDLLLKGIVRPAVLCLKSFSTNQGTCLAGCWYAFSPDDIHEQLMSSSRNGRTYFSVDSGSLVFLRDAVDYKPKTKEERLADARKFAQELKEETPPWEWKPNPFPRLLE